MSDGRKTKSELIQEIQQLRKELDHIKKQKSRQGIEKSRNAALNLLEDLQNEIEERKKADEALQKSESLFRTLVNESPAGIYLTDAEGNYQFVNPGWCAMAGLTPEEAQGDGWKKGLYKDDRDAVFENWKKMVASRGKWSFQYRFQNSDGRITWVEGIATELRDEDNQITGYLGTNTDITERRMAEQAVRENEERYRQLFEAESDAIFLIDNETGLILEANKAAIALYDFSHEELLMMKNTELSAEPDKTRRVTETTPIIEDNVVSISLRYHQKKDGTVFPVEITGRFFEWKRRPVHVAAIRDITGRVNSEEMLRHDNELLEKITETSPIGITVANAEGQIIFANKRAEEILHLSKDKITQLAFNAPAWQITDFEGNPFPNEQLPFNQVRETGKAVFDVRHAIGLPNGRRRLLSINAAPLFDEKGNFESMVSAIEDVTERQKVEKNLKERNTFIQTIIENLQIGLAVNRIDDGTATYMNRKFEEIYGWPSEIMKDVPRFFECVYPDPEYRKEIQTRVMADIQSGDPKRMAWDDLVVTHQDGTRRIISAKNIPLFEQNLMISTVQDVTVQTKAKDALEKHRQELKNLSVQLIRTQEEERKRLSRELHDEIGQSLTGIKLNIAALGKKLEGQFSQSIRTLLTETDSLADNLLEQVHDISLDLRPNMLDDLGLTPTLRWYVKQGQKRWPFTVELDIEALMERLPSTYETALYRIVQESLNNAARHAHPETVTVRIRIRDDALELYVHDNGAGFDPAKIKDRPPAEQGIGLIGIHERVSALGGKFNVQSQPGKGATIQVSLPMP